MLIKIVSYTCLKHKRFYSRTHPVATSASRPRWPGNSRRSLRTGWSPEWPWSTSDVTERRRPGKSGRVISR